MRILLLLLLYFQHYFVFVTSFQLQRSDFLVQIPSKFQGSLHPNISRPCSRTAISLVPVDKVSDTDSLEWLKPVSDDPKRSVYFSLAMTACGAALGPFLDAYHSAFGVLEYNHPISIVLWGSEKFPALTTAWWVPELFGLAGFIIGWLCIILDKVLVTEKAKTNPLPRDVFVGISMFTLQYWLSGILFYSHVDRVNIMAAMSLVASIGFFALDGTLSGFVTSAATAIGGPLIEVILLWLSSHGSLAGGYHYNDIGETGFFPLWIAPVYFMGGSRKSRVFRFSCSAWPLNVF